MAARLFWNQVETPFPLDHGVGFASWRWAMEKLGLLPGPYCLITPGFSEPCIQALKRTLSVVTVSPPLGMPGTQSAEPHSRSFCSEEWSEV